MRSMIGPLALGLFSLTACGGATRELNGARTAYEGARYEDAEVWLSEVESHYTDLTESERARYYYLRGMTQLRIGQRDEALHLLTMAKMASDSSPRALETEWRTNLERNLQALVPTTATFRARAAADAVEQRRLEDEATQNNLENEAPPAAQ